MRAILNVENWSRFTLLDSQTDIHCGAVLPRYQATNIYPGYREVMLGVGTEIFGGTCGTVSWQVRALPPLLFDLQPNLSRCHDMLGREQWLGLTRTVQLGRELLWSSWFVFRLWSCQSDWSSCGVFPSTSTSTTRTSASPWSTIRWDQLQLQLQLQL